MKHRIMTAAAVLACGLGAAWQGAQAAGLEVYGRLPVMDQVTISPDGTKIAFVQPVDGKQAVVVDQLNPAAALTGLPGNDKAVRALIWADPTHLLVVRTQAANTPDVEDDRSEWHMVQSLDLGKRKVTALLDLDNAGPTRSSGPSSMNVVVGHPQPRLVKGRPTVFARGVAFGEGGRTIPTLYSVDLESNHVTMVDRTLSGPQERDWIVDNQGELVAQATNDAVSHQMGVRLRRGGGWVDGYSAPALTDPPAVMGASADGAALIVRTTQDGAVSYRPLTLADGKLGEPIKAYDGLTRLIEDPATHRIIGGVRAGMQPEYVFSDPRDQAVWAGVANAFPGEDVELASWSDNRSRIVVRVTGPAHGVVYVLVDLAAHKATPIGEAYQGLKPDDMAEVHVATYPAADGRAIKAFLTLPNGREPKGLPMIVLPHGGPAAHNASGYDWWAQALAARGYAVLQPQFRGSTGFGSELQQAGFGQWGRKMQSDLSDGVRALASKGYIDAKRVCIVGADYGGYAALAGVTLEHGVYRCAVAVAGMSDLRRVATGGKPDPSRAMIVGSWGPFIGAKGAGDPVYDQLSPALHADKADAPILLIHAHEDPIVPFEQSESMAAALKAAGKPVELVSLPGEDHWLSRDDTRLQTLQATVKFLEANNPPG